MSENSNEKRYKYGFYESYDFDVFTWKIPNISSISHTVDYTVQSPLFSFRNSSWCFKMYPYGQRAEGSEGYMDVILQRTDYQGENLHVHFHIFCEDVFGKTFNSVRKEYLFMPLIATKCKLLHFIHNLKDNPEKWRIAPNDTFTLVCALEKREYPILATRSVQQNLNKMYKTRSNNENPEIGQICKEYSALTCFSAKIYYIEPDLPAGYCISEPFSFANASWMLKIYPYFQMEGSNKHSFDVLIERLHSEIPEHSVVLEIIMPSTDNGIVEKYLFFNAYHCQGDAINLHYKKPSNTTKCCLHFDLIMRMKKNAGLESVSQTKLMELAEVGDNISGSPATLQKNNVLQNFKKLYLQQEDCDVVFKVKEKEFPAHRLILKAQSPVLASALRIDMKEKATGIINIEDCEPAIFSDFLYFLYCAEVSLSKDNVFGLFTVADKYDVSDLRAMCIEFIKNNLSVDTFCDTIALALLHSETELVKLSTDFFATNLQEIIVTVKWQSFIVENPIQGNELMVKTLVPN